MYGRVLGYNDVKYSSRIANNDKALKETILPVLTDLILAFCSSELILILAAKLQKLFLGGHCLRNPIFLSDNPTLPTINLATH